MNTKLITALRSAANAIEKETIDYDWGKPSRCNCGSLFCALTGMAPADLRKRIPTPEGENGSWTSIVGQFCPISGVPANELFKELFSYGLTSRDVVDLEYLENEEVVAHVKLQPSQKKWWKLSRTQTELDHKNPDHVVAYMRAWADLLQEKGQANTIPTALDKEAAEKV